MIKFRYFENRLKKYSPYLIGTFLIVLPFQNCGKGFNSQQSLTASPITNGAAVLTPPEQNPSAEEFFKINPLVSSASQLAQSRGEVLSYEIELLSPASTIVDAKIEVLDENASTYLDPASAKLDPTCMFNSADFALSAGKIRFQPGKLKCTFTLPSVMIKPLVTDFKFSVQVTVKNAEGKTFVKTAPGQMLVAPTNVIVGPLFSGGHIVCKKNPDGNVFCKGFLYDVGNQSPIFESEDFILISQFKNAVQIADTGNAACALKSDGSVSCMGEQAQFPSFAGAANSRIQALDGELGFRCPLLFDGHLGINGVCELTPNNLDRAQNFSYPTDRVFSSVASGMSFGCGVTSDGQVFCWGSNSYGQLGSGDISQNDLYPARQVPGLMGYDVKKILVGGSSTICALTSGKEVFCWGKNALSETPKMAAAPKKLNLSRVTDLKIDYQYICAIQEGDQWSCFYEDETQARTGILPGIKAISSYIIPLFQVQDGSWKCPVAGRYYNSGTGLECWPQ